MKIEKTKKLAYRDVVYFPEDRGEPAGSGVVIKDTSDSEIQTNIYGKEYVWVHIRVGGLDGRMATWPSNRLN